MTSENTNHKNASSSPAPLPASDWFSADRPIGSAAEDRLGRTRFAGTIADAVRGWHGSDSLVLAMCGPWGTGKSSFKNLVVEVLQKGPPSIQVVEFNPWRFATREDLSTAFFDEVGVALGRNSLATRKALVRAWRRYHTRLTAGGELLAAFKGPLAWILAALTFVLAGAAMRYRWITPITGVALLLAIAALRWSGRFTRAVADLLSAGVESDQKTLEEVRTDLAKELMALRQPIVVIVDDLDRLAPPEVAEMCQLVKANADFPNLVYVLLFDKKSVAERLEAHLKVSGDDYLEKIIQASFTIPRTDPSKVHKILFEGLDRLLAHGGLEQRFDQQRWLNLFGGGLQQFFETPRDVKRYLATLAVHVSVFEGRRAFDVNPIDLIGIEVLRLFVPAVYDQLPSLKHTLTRDDRTRPDFAKKEVEKIVAAGDAHREQVEQILRALFPPMEWALGGSHYDPSFQNDWERDLRVCSPPCFDRYFELSGDPDALTQSDIDDILEQTGDRNALVTLLMDHGKKGRLKAVLERLEAYKTTVPSEHASAFITAMFDIGEHLAHERDSLSDIAAIMHAERIVFWYVRERVPAEQRQAVLAESLSNTKGVSLPVMFVSLESSAEERGRTTDAMFDEAALARLRELCLQRIHGAALDGGLGDTPELGAILYRWREWESDVAPRAFSTRLVATPAGALRLLRAFTTSTRSQTIGEYAVREFWYLTLGELEGFAPIDTIESALRSVDRASLGIEDARAFNAFQAALARRRQGRPDYTGSSIVDGG